VIFEEDADDDAGGTIPRADEGYVGLMVLEGA
jgi:hypothetical protein